MLLEYQLVNPGSYIDLTDAAYTNNWTLVPMNDAGANGDLVAGDNVYSADLPGSIQTHRRLVRYRMTVSDMLGFSVRVPYADDPQPNFAYFVYDGVPAWTGAIQPSATSGTNMIPFTVGGNEMSRLPVYFLIAKSNAVAQATWFSRDASSLYRWIGTLVYDGKVYDHIHYRMRGGVWRYSMVKNMWKFDLNRGHDFEARDNWGKKYKVPWGKLSLGSCIQQGDYWHRGEQGMFESVGARLFELGGVPSFRTTFNTFRIIDDTMEVNPSSQYEGDFWGLYLTTENEDGRFLENHDLPDSNLYKMDGAYGSPPAKINNMSPTGPSDASDIKWILANYTAAQSETWWRTNWNVEKFYSYQAVLMAFHHYDINGGKNYFYYYNGNTKLWEVLPWDLDLSWAHNMYNNGSGWGGLNALAVNLLKATSEAGTGSQSGTYNVRLTGDAARPNFEREFRNRVREIRDLLFNTDQTWRLIDEYAWLVRGPNTNGSIIDADRCQWDYNPKMDNGTYTPNVSKATSGRFYQFPQESGTNAALKGSFDATIQIMKNYVGIRSEHLDAVALDMRIPNTPAITYTGDSNYPINRLTFHCSNFSSPSNHAFAYMRWRVGEVSDYDVNKYNPTERWKYEIEPVWDSGPISVFTPDVTIPGSVLRVGARYRVRAQFTDGTGRNSHWSLPIEFVCGEQANLADLMNFLRITEVMYNPPENGFEYVELYNFSPTVTLDLGGVKFTDGIDFAFTNGTLMPPGSYLLVIGTPFVNFFRAYYGIDDTVPIVWAFTGKLDNSGEKLTLKTSAGGSNIVSFTYGDGRGWPGSADGFGNSIVLLDSAISAEGDGSAEYGLNWRPSTYLKGSPGQVDPVFGTPPLLINEVAANTWPINGLPSNDWIELYNPGDTPFTVGPNWYLSDDGINLAKWMIPSNTVVPARGFVSFDEQTGFHNPTNTGFGISKAGEQIFLAYLPGTAENRVVDSVDFKAQEEEMTLGRYPDGSSYWHALTPTRDASNAAPRPQIVISEVMYHPADIGTNDNTLDEFIELWNSMETAVELQNSNGTWRINGGVGLVFPTNTVIGPHKFLLAVNFDPATNQAQVAAFKSLYGITDPDVAMVGPYNGKLNNSSDRVALEKPQFELPGLPEWVIVDEVIYLDQSPWPCGSDASGASLQRISASGHGSDPANWTAQSPTAGVERAPQPPGAPTIVAQPVSQRVPANSTVMFLVNVCGTPPYGYQWFFNGEAITGANNNSLVLPDVAMTNAGQYQVVVSNSAGGTFSVPAGLDVYYVPVGITQQPRSVALKGSSFPQMYGQTSSNWTFRVMVTGSKPVSYQWRRNGIELPWATGPELVLTNASLADEGTYSVTVSNILEVVSSSNATLRIFIDPAIRQQPPQTTVVTGSTVLLPVVAVGNPMPLGYRWRRDGAPVLPGGYVYTNATNITLTLAKITTNSGGTYIVTVTNSAYSIPGAVSSPAYVTVVIPPTNVTVTAGQRATLRLAAFCGRETTNLVYRWQFNGLNIDDSFPYLVVRSNVTMLEFTNTTIAQAGTYTVIVTNPAKYATEFTAILDVITPPGADSDGDGMPDLWEHAQGIDPSVADGDRDADGDGMSNWKEYLAGTGPSDPQDVLRLQFFTTNSLLLQFNAKSNKAYAIEYRTEPGNGAWDRLMEWEAASTNRVLQQTEPFGPDKRFYRILLPTTP